jgi:hypothetical protein
MQILIITLLVLVSLAAIVLISAIFVKREYEIERETVIDRSCEEVFDYVRHLKNQDHYSKWVMTDPTMKKIFKGDDGKPGFIYGWNVNNKAGEGEQEIVLIVEDKRIDTEIRFVRPFESTAQIHMTTESILPNKTKVTWGMAGKSNYPMNLMNPMIGKMLGKDLEISLQTLKNLLEKRGVLQEA